MIGAVGARKVKMTAMPQMVALFNGVGGGAAALVSLVEFHTVWAIAGNVGVERGISTVLSALIGSISFAGSMVAFAKLQELISGQPITFPGQQIVNGLIFVAAVALGIWSMAAVSFWGLAAMILVASLFGVMFVLPIGGADMPVVISLLNAFTGLAAAATGFVLHSNVLIVSGMLVGASGTLLTMKMGSAMNRSIANVLFGAFGKVVAGPAGAPSGADGATVRSTTADDVAVMLAYAKRVVVVPGYGLAVAQAQHEVRQLAELLESEGRRREVRDPSRRGPHARAHERPARGGERPVRRAEGDGRDQPGVPADRRRARDRRERRDEPGRAQQPGEPDLRHADPQRRPGAAGVVLKRSMRPGFAGIDNELYTEPKTSMLFGDAKESVQKLVQAVKAV